MQEAVENVIIDKKKEVEDIRKKIQWLIYS